MTGIVRDKVRQSFSSHAIGYDDYAVVQKRVVARFLERYCDYSQQPAKLLDVGAGTGRLLAALGNCYPQAVLHGVDLAYGMAKRGKAQSAKLLIACSDAEQLPFRNNSFELVVSTSTYQWLENLEKAFAEAYRVLLPGGRFCFALFGGETLYELRSSYRLALTESGGLLPDRSHTFFSLQEALATLQMAGFAETAVECEREVEFYRTAKEVLAAIKGVGAGSAAKEQGRGLSGRKVIERMISLYEQQYGSAEGIPATYDVLYGTGVKQ
jgi:malonyl-CoA O-methyltransferase